MRPQMPGEEVLSGCNRGIREGQYRCPLYPEGILAPDSILAAPIHTGFSCIFTPFSLKGAPVASHGCIQIANITALARWAIMR